MTNEWRYACPKDHRSLLMRNGENTKGRDRPYWYCKTCRKQYDRGEIVDLKTGAKV